MPDIRQIETKMRFFLLAAGHMDAEIEAIHSGQLDLVGRNDPEYRKWADLLQHVRGYAAKKACRHHVNCAPKKCRGLPESNYRTSRTARARASSLRCLRIGNHSGASSEWRGESESRRPAIRSAICPRGWRVCPKSSGPNTTWYLQSHLEWDRL